MAPKPKTITVTLAEPQEKKNVMRYDCDEDGAAMRTVYVDKAALKPLATSGFFPQKIKVTIEAA
jgi:hypothetical protein